MPTNATNSGRSEKVTTKEFSFHHQTNHSKPQRTFLKSFHLSQEENANSLQRFRPNAIRPIQKTPPKALCHKGLKNKFEKTQSFPNTAIKRISEKNGNLSKTRRFFILFKHSRQFSTGKKKDSPNGESFQFTPQARVHFLPSLPTTTAGSSEILEKFSPYFRLSASWNE